MSGGSITRLLEEHRRGVAGAQDRLFRRIYDELRRMAAGRMRRERPSPSRGTTDLVHEAYARLEGEDFENRRLLFYAYAREMRRFLIQAARTRGAVKRGGGMMPVGLRDADAADPRHDRTLSLGVLDVDELLELLRCAHPRPADVVELRFFGGLENQDIAEVLGVTERTVSRDWCTAKAWLRRRLGDAGSALPEDGSPNQ